MMIDLTKAAIAFVGMDVQHAEFPLGTIVRFYHEERIAKLPDLEELKTLPKCHGYLRALSFNGYGRAQYDLECIQHREIVREVAQFRIERISLLEQLAIASV
jgi:hypothetical protein